MSELGLLCDLGLAETAADALKDGNLRKRIEPCVCALPPER